MLDMDAAISQIEQALSLAKSLNKAAAVAKNEATQSKALEGRLKDAFKDLKGAALIQSAPEGIASATPQSQLHTAGEHLHHISGGDTGISAGQNFTAHALNGVNLFAQTAGMKMQANQGKVAVQAQNDEMQLNALKDVTLTSSNGRVTIAAKEEILITCQGAYIRLADGEVEIGTPKMIRFKGPLEVTGNNSLNYFVKPPAKAPTWLAFQYLDGDMQPMKSVKYKAYFKTGEVIKGSTDAKGFYEIDNPPSDIVNLVIEDEPVRAKQDSIFDYLKTAALQEKKNG